MSKIVCGSKRSVSVNISESKSVRGGEWEEEWEREEQEEEEEEEEWEEEWVYECGGGLWW